MRKLWIVLIIVLIIGAGAVVAIFNLDRIVKAKKDFFLAGIEEKTGRNVEFDDIRIAVWGGLGVRVTGVSATDDPAFSGENFIEAKELDLKVALWPLLKKQLQVKKVVLSKPIIRVIRDANGRFNFESIGTPGESSGQHAAQPSGGGVDASYALFIAFADIADGELVFIDKKTDMEVRARRIDLAVQDVRLDEPFTARLQASFLSGGDEQNVHVESRIGPVGDNPLPSTIPLDVDVQIDPLSTSQVVALQPIAKLLPKDLAVKGPVETRGHAEGTLESMRVEGGVKMDACDIALGERFHKAAGIPCRLDATAGISGGTLRIEKSDVTFHKMNITGGGTVALKEPRRVQMNLQSDKVDLSGWETLLPRIEPYRIGGEMELQLDIDGTIKPGVMPGGSGSLTAEQITFTPPRAVQPLRNVKGKALFHLGDREITVDSLSLWALGGVIRSAGRIDVSEKPVHFAFDTKASDVDLAELLISTPVGAEKHAEGKVNLDLLFAGQGTRWEDISRSIDGQGTLAVMEGVILDVNIVQMIFGDIGKRFGAEDVISAELRSKYPQVFTANKTIFKSIDGLVRIEKGRVILPKMDLGTADYTITGTGSIQLDRVVQSQAALVLSPRLSEDVIKQISIASMITDEKGRVRIPFTLSGTLPKVTVKPDLSAEVKTLPITPEVDKLKNKLLDKIFPKKK